MTFELPSPRFDETWSSRLREVRETGDRRATFALLEALFYEPLGASALDELCATLTALEDPRCVAPLEAALLDEARPTIVRAASLEVLQCVPRDEPARESVQAWLHDADPLVRAHGVAFLDAPDGGRLAAAMRDPDTLVRRSAAEAVVSLVRTSSLVDAVQRALRDVDPIVREAACRAALFDEPLPVLFDVLRLLGDHEPCVRRAACDALEDFPCVSVLLALADSRGVGDDPGTVDVALATVVRRVAFGLEGAEGSARRRLERWAAPASWVLEGARRDAARPRPERGDGEDVGGGHELPRALVDVDAAARVLSDDDASPGAQREMLLARSWTRAGDAGLAVLEDCATHSSWALRNGAAIALYDVAGGGNSRAMDRLTALSDDTEVIVRRTAVEALARLGDRRALPGARALLGDSRSRATAGDVALDAISRLAPEQEAAAAVLGELACDDDRDGLLLGAVHLAERLGLEAAGPELAHVASEPVVSGVGCHVAALRALRGFGQRPPDLDLSHLEGLDHLDVQRELGAWDWRGPRYG